MTGGGCRWQIASDDNTANGIDTTRQSLHTCGDKEYKNFAFGVPLAKMGKMFDCCEYTLTPWMRLEQTDQHPSDYPGNTIKFTVNRGVACKTKPDQVIAFCCKD